jgi:hypothetical protein
LENEAKMSVPAKVKEADIMRALRAAKKVGAKRVIVGADGSIDIWLEGGPAIAEGKAATKPAPNKYPLIIDDDPEVALEF